MSSEAPNLTKVEENQTSNFPDKVSTSNAKQENFLRICRLCLSLENVKSFFDTSYAEVSIPELLFDFTSLKVRFNRKLIVPTYVSKHDLFNRWILKIVCHNNCVRPV